MHASGDAMLGGGAYFEERNNVKGKAYDVHEQPLPEMTQVFGPSKKEKEETEEKEVKAQEPLPKIPPMPMTVDDAYTFLGLAENDRGDLEKLKMKFRKMCLKWHPDKNIRRAEAAGEVFKAVNAAYHTLTTNNFDYDRWAEAFVIPPMQSLEDVLMMALKGADPYQIEILLKRRGDYRPHQDFGVNLSIPWNAGSKDNPSFHVHTGNRAYSKTQGLEGRERGELGWDGNSSDPYGGGQLVRHVETADLLEQFGEKAQVGHDSDARPWETVGGIGFGSTSSSSPKPAYKKPDTRPDLNERSKDAKEVAEQFNDRAVKAFKAKKWQEVYDLSSEAIRLNPKKTAYLGNRAAAALKIKSRRMLRQAAEDSVLAYEMDDKYVKAYVRAAQAHLEIGERNTVKLAIQEYEKAVQLDPDNKTYKEGLKDAQLTWEADWA
mmetsp:Transcript_50546/g.83778  ORF Transcript_50546/g.83778 Transcript_50546/m.83778 type:complete len:433 (+) Transcript_50546:42-1340(+)